ncbi:MinD/ParA family ATP-binding protein [Noviherbaspirillum sp. Root189]|uniref:MinD/ParA family ATP-binding protein n=1 Tax=Noviherbaspirillum sp. Root189 TaxID=1736487 RepID=UPI00070A3D84|nr:hypothetical protein [Noviherbaspirillum sp. Root189]KRB93349.1 antiactivator of flagellar biosynthesis FleN protein [Noviherbaspirillum sp. Root189]
MASFDFDQAEGLRRMLAGPKPRVFTFLSAASAEEKGAMLVNLGASLAQAGRDVLLVDACVASEGIASRLGAMKSASLVQVAQRERALDDAIQPMPQGFGVAALRRGAQKIVTGNAEQMQRLDDAFGVLSARADIVVVDAELDKDDAFTIPALAGTEIVVQVSNTPASIKAAYTLIKRVNSQLGRRPFSILVTGASDKDAQLVYQNMAQAANRYLAVKLNSMGSVPADEHLKKAMHLGRAVVDAFPLAGASVAFRRLAGKFVLSDVATAG